MKEIKAVIIPTLLELDARYCEAMVQADNEPAKRLLEHVGFSPKSEVLTNYGAFGKDFVLFAISNPGDIPNVFTKN